MELWKDSAVPSIGPAAGVAYVSVAGSLGTGISPRRCAYLYLIRFSMIRDHGVYSLIR